MGNRSIPHAIAVGALVACTACQPESPTAAREQLGRNAQGTISFTLPVADTSFLVSELLGDLDTVTTPAGLLGIVQRDTVVAPVGQELEFNGVGFDPFSFSYADMLVTDEVSTSVTFPSPPASAPSEDVVQARGVPNDTVQFTTPGGSQVTGATIASGWIVRTMVNNTICDGDVSVALVDDTGSNVVNMPDVTVNAGQTVVDSTDASGASVSGFVAVSTSVSFGACVPGVNDAVASDVVFRPMQLASVSLQNVSEAFNENYDVLSSEARLNTIDTVRMSGGSITLTVSNRLPMQMAFEIVLNGFLDQAGNVLRDSVIVPPAIGDGSYTSGTATFDLTNVTLLPGLAIATASGAATAANAVLTSGVVNDAVLVAGNGDIVIASLSGSLDPAVTPELSVSVEEFEELNADDFDFDDLRDAIQSSRLNRGRFVLAMSNSADVSLRLSNFTIGVVELDAQGQVPRDGSGNPIYASDCSGSPTVLIADSGQTTVMIPATGTVNLSIPAASVIDCTVHNLLDDDRVALLASGTATAGDGSPAVITRNDEVTVAMDVIIGLDFTIPPAGVTFTRNQTASGLDLGDDEADELTERLVSAGLVAAVANSTPFMVEIEVAIVPDSVGENVDIFSMPTAVILDMVTLSNAQVDPNGVPISAATDSVSLSISGEDVRVVFGQKYTAGIRIRLAPRPDGGTRGAIRPEDGVDVDASVQIEVRRGNS